MEASNYERMIKMAESVFDVKNDPDQLDVDESVLERLLQIHPAAVTEFDQGNGPVLWLLLIPTNTELMNLFLNNAISEKQLFENTPQHEKYDCIYLCSVMLLEEYRGEGLAKRLCVDAIESIRKVHDIKTLFVWAFSDAGEKLAEKIAQQTELVLRKK